MTGRTAVFAHTVEDARRAMGELGLDRQRSIAISSRNGRSAARGCIIDRLIFIDNAFPEPDMRIALLCTMVGSRAPEIFRWQRESL